MGTKGMIKKEIQYELLSMCNVMNDQWDEVLSWMAICTKIPKM